MFSPGEHSWRNGVCVHFPFLLLLPRSHRPPRGPRSVLLSRYFSRRQLESAQAILFRPAGRFHISEKGPLAGLGKTFGSVGDFCFMLAESRRVSSKVVSCPCYIQAPLSCTAFNSWQVEAGRAPGRCFPLTCVHLSGAEILAAEGGRGDGGFQDVAQVLQLKSGAPSTLGRAPPFFFCTQRG